MVLRGCRRKVVEKSDEEVVEFAGHHGLQTFGDVVVLDRNCFVDPETSYITRRAVSVIESKQQTSVGEVRSQDSCYNFVFPLILA